MDGNYVVLKRVLMGGQVVGTAAGFLVGNGCLCCCRGGQRGAVGSGGEGERLLGK